MKILALETSGATGGVALLDDARLLAELALDPRRRSAQSLAPAVAEVLAAAGRRPTEVHIVAVTVGPGSFTSLRVGVTTAKVFAYAVGAAVLGINTLEAIAAESSLAAKVDIGATIAAAIDAQRGDVYAARFRAVDDGQLECLAPPAIHRADDWLAALEHGWTITGPALETLAARLPGGVTIAPREAWMPAAATVGRLGARKYAAGQRDDLWTLAPFYLRKSAAEEKRGV